jgi:type 1 glutamine amidotransferase
MNIKINTDNLMKRLLLTIILALPILHVSSQPVKIMLVTGGHAFDTIQFFDMFDALKDIEYEQINQPKANQRIASGKTDNFDVLVFYDMWTSIGEIEKQAYLKLTQQGKPMLFLHHSIASYQDWPEFEKIIGGKYVQAERGVPVEDQSNYEHDVWVYSKVENITPVTHGFGELRFFDEIYGNVRVSDNVFPLLKTRHPKSMEIIAWENRYNKSKIVYIQPGHDYRTYAEESYRKLLSQAIHYLAGK